MEGHSQVRFSDTPPDSPKSCMKGSRRINFAEPSGDDGPGECSASSSSAATASAAPRSPKRSTKTVVIRSPAGSATGAGAAASSSSSASTSTDVGTTAEENVVASSSSAAASSSSSSSSGPKRPAEIQFQFHLSQHYEQSTPPPNCTSNGDSHHNYDEDASGEAPDPDDSNNADQDPRLDPQLIEIATKFVAEIIETAKIEAASRQQKAEAGEDIKIGPMSAFRAVAEDLLGGRNPWYRRAHGAISKWITNLCVRAQNSIRT